MLLKIGLGFTNIKRLIISQNLRLSTYVDDYSNYWEKKNSAFLRMYVKIRKMKEKKKGG